MVEWSPVALRHRQPYYTCVEVTTCRLKYVMNEKFHVFSPWWTHSHLTPFLTSNTNILQIMKRPLSGTNSFLNERTTYNTPPHNKRLEIKPRTRHVHQTTSTALPVPACRHILIWCFVAVSPVYLFSRSWCPPFRQIRLSSSLDVSVCGIPWHGI